MIAPGLFRLVLATIVIVAHFSKLAIGALAVDLFFALSGYWIYLMYDAKYRLARLSGPLFIASRFMRLLPVFLLFNTSALLLHFAWSDATARATTGWAWMPNVLVVGYASLPQRPMVPAWSLDIELQFYLVFPFLFWLLRLSPWFGRLLCPLLLFTGGWYISLHLQDNATNVLPYGGFFLSGVLAAQSKAEPPPWLVRGCSAIAIIGLAAILAIPAWRGLGLHSINSLQFKWNTGLNFGLALLLTPLALATVFRRSSRSDRILGDLSYVVYCNHWIGVMLSEEYLSGVSRWAKAPMIAGILLVVYGVSFAVLIYLDRPISRWRERRINAFLRSPGSLTDTIVLR